MEESFKTFDRELQNLSGQLEGLTECIRPTELPEVLYHYTASSGLLGIIENSCMWATNYRFLNDSKELQYGVELTLSTVDELRKLEYSKTVQSFFDRIPHTANAFDGMFDCYVTCFCEEKDLLSQWRTYANTSGGYAIGFKTNRIGKRIQLTSPGHSFHLRKVLYDPSKQKAVLHEVIKSISDLLEANFGKSTPEESNTAIALCCSMLRAVIADFIICFKHPAFAVEQEWRMCHVVSPTNGDHIKYRDGPYGITPYVELDPSPSSGIHHNKLPVDSIQFGPSRDPKNTQFSLERLLRSNGYTFVDIFGSKLPVRLTN